MLLLGFTARELVTVGMRRTGKVAISPTIHTSPSQASSLQAALCWPISTTKKPVLVVIGTGKITFPPFLY